MFHAKFIIVDYLLECSGWPFGIFLESCWSVAWQLYHSKTKLWLYTLVNNSPSKTEKKKTHTKKKSTGYRTESWRRCSKFVSRLGICVWLDTLVRPGTKPDAVPYCCPDWVTLFSCWHFSIYFHSWIKFLVLLLTQYWSFHYAGEEAKKEVHYERKYFLPDYTQRSAMSFIWTRLTYIFMSLLCSVIEAS